MLLPPPPKSIMHTLAYNCVKEELSFRRLGSHARLAGIPFARRRPLLLFHSPLYYRWQPFLLLVRSLALYPQTCNISPRFILSISPSQQLSSPSSQHKRGKGRRAKTNTLLFRAAYIWASLQLRGILIIKSGARSTMKPRPANNNNNNRNNVFSSYLIRRNVNRLAIN